MRGVFGMSMCTAAVICGLSGAALARPGSDVIVGDLPSAANNPANGTFDAFAIGTTSCNPGDVPLNWFTGGTDNRHPVIGQNVFRLHNGRFEQIGQAWLKHGFTALQQNACNLGCSATGGSTLGVGCSDPYGAGLNNGQSGLGPKWQVNPSTGMFPYPFANPGYSGEIARRIRVRLSELDAATYPGALYFVEGQYIGGDDSANNNAVNNASYRRANITGGTAEYNMALSGFTGAANTVRQLPGIYAWQAQDASVTIQTADVTGDGRYLLACKVSGPVGGVYTYEYALHNLNSHRSAASFSVPFPTAGAASASTARGFRDVEYHSGEPNETAVPASDDWSVAPTGSSLTWSGPSYAGTPPVYTTSGLFVTGFTAGTGNDHSANALRWGTLFNFRFQSTTAPAVGQVQVGMFRPGTPSSFTIAVRTPGGATTGTPSTGPCCVGTACSVTTQAGCSGTFGSIGSTCTPDPCLTGSCCVASDGSCTVTTQSACTANWNSGGVCIPNSCPVPTGACCTAGSCTVTTAAACSGTYRGNATSCTPTLCTNAVNDICSAAIGVCDGVNINGTNVNAGEEAAACAQSNSDVWYRYVPASTGPVDVSTIAGGSIADTVLSIHTACGGAFVACDDDSGTGNLSFINDFAATAGTTYYIRVASWGSSAEGTFVLRVVGGGGQTCISNGSCCQADQTCAVTTQVACSGVYSGGGTCTPNVCPPPNDNCAGRIGLGTGTIAISTLFATTDGIDHPALCNFFSNPGISNDIWYNHPSLVTGTLDISTCGSAFDTEIAVYSGPTCGDYESRLIACNDDAAGCANNGSFLTISVVAGQNYLIRVGGFNGAAGTGTLTLTATPVAVNGTCCAADGGCTFTTEAACSATWASGGSCTPNSCAQPTGACCTGTACSVTTAAGCTGAFQGAGSACGGAGNPTTCCPANYNDAGGVTVQDIFDFLAGYFANDPAADFNGAGGLTVQDIFDFLAAYFTGC